MGRASGNRDCSVPARASRSRSRARTFPTPVPSAAAMPRRTTPVSWIATWPIRPDVAGFRAAPTPPRSSARRCRPRKSSASRWTAPRPLHADGARPARSPLAGPGRLCRPLRRRLAGRALPVPARRLRRALLPVRAGRPVDRPSARRRGGPAAQPHRRGARGLPRAAQGGPGDLLPEKGWPRNRAGTDRYPAGGLRRPSRGSHLAHSPTVEAQPVRDRPGAGRQQVRRLVARPRAGQGLLPSLAALARSRQAEEDEA